MQVSASYPIAGMPTIHGTQQWLDIRQPVLELKQDYVPIGRRELGADNYREVNRTISQRLWIC